MISSESPGKFIDPSLEFVIMYLNSINAQQNFILVNLAVFQKQEIRNEFRK